jgi:hypothetical protein
VGGEKEGKKGEKERDNRKQRFPPSYSIVIDFYSCREAFFGYGVLWSLHLSFPLLPSSLPALFPSLQATGYPPSLRDVVDRDGRVVEGAGATALGLGEGGLHVAPGGFGEVGREGRER